MAVDLRQTHFRFGLDNGTEAAHGWIAAEDTNATVFTGTIFLLRFTMQESGGTATVDTDFQFQYNKGGAGWNDITISSSVVKAVAVDAFTNGANCTKRLSGTGTFESSAAGCTEDGSSGGTACDIAANGNTETECGLQIVDADVADGDTIQFRITSPDYSVTYDVTPTLTVEKTGITVSKAVGYAVISQPSPAIAVSKTIGYAVLIDIQSSINVSKVVGYAVVEESGGAAPYDDGTPDGGIVFGGEVVEVGTSSYADGTPVGGIVMGGPAGSEFEPEENHQVDEECFGGITFDGGVAERWYNPWAVAVKGGTYRIGGEIYTLEENLSYEGLGSIAALVILSAAPAAANEFRYDLLSIDAAGTITVTEGAESTDPEMPDTPDDEVKLDHVLRYYGQTYINQADIGKLYAAPALTTITAAVTDDELAWGEASTTIVLTFKDQYGTAFSGSKVVNAAVSTGNGTITPAAKSGTGTTFTFTYTRGGAVTDESPVLTFTATTGPYATAFITLLDAGGNIMTS